LVHECILILQNKSNEVDKRLIKNVLYERTYLVWFASVSVDRQTDRQLPLRLRYNNQININNDFENKNYAIDVAYRCDRTSVQIGLSMYTNNLNIDSYDL
jgi:hypothetical protein